jgi:hypothetical protein
VPTNLVQAVTPGGDPTGTRHRNLAREGNGRILVVYCVWDGVRDQIWLSHSDDDGFTWTHQQLTNNAVGSQRNPSITVDSQNNIHIAWDGYGWGANPARANIQYLRWDVVTGWDAQLALTDVPHNQGSVAIGCDSLDNIYVLWWGEGHIVPLASDKIILRWRSSAGVWSGNEYLVNLDNQTGPALAIDRLNRLHLIWAGRGWGVNPGNYNVQYLIGVPGAWGVQEAITDVAFDQRSPQITLDSLNMPHVCWQGLGWGAFPAAQNIIYRNQAAGIWQPVEFVTDFNLVSINAFISADTSNRIYVHWEEGGAINLRRRVAGVWETLSVVSTAGTHVCSMWANWPVIGGLRNNIRSNGYSIVFTGVLAPDVAVYYSFPAGATWPSLPVVVNPKVATLPATGVT